MNKFKKGKTIKMIFITILGIVFGCIIFFALPQSPLKSKFHSMVQEALANTPPAAGVFTKEDIKNLPQPIQRYFESCSYIGKPKAAVVRITYRDVKFRLGLDKPEMKIKYTQYNFFNRPDRLAFIDASMFGIPFQGIDRGLEGKGAMTGVIAKAFTVFDSKGPEMDQAVLVTVLGEAPCLPSIFLQDYIAYEELNDSQVKATIEYKGNQASGIYTFNDRGEFINFTTEDRYLADTNGQFKKCKWTAIAGEYKEINGLRVPGRLQAVWSLPEEEFLYFDGSDIQYDYDIQSAK